jgi:hypothetical protein
MPSLVAENPRRRADPGTGGGCTAARGGQLGLAVRPGWAGARVKRTTSGSRSAVFGGGVATGSRKCPGRLPAPGTSRCSCPRRGRSGCRSAHRLRSGGESTSSRKCSIATTGHRANVMGAGDVGNSGYQSGLDDGSDRVGCCDWWSSARVPAAPGSEVAVLVRVARVIRATGWARSAEVGGGSATGSRNARAACRPLGSRQVPRADRATGRLTGRSGRGEATR